jgi:hypothetical protein
MLSSDEHQTAARTVNADGRDHQITATPTVVCVECGCSSGLFWGGWGAYRIDDPETGEPPQLAFYCPACAAFEFDRRPRRRRD